MIFCISKIIKKVRLSFKLSLTLLPIIVIMTSSIIWLDYNTVESLSKQNLEIYTDNSASKLESWVNIVNKELSVYKRNIENEKLTGEELSDYLKKTYNISTIYPFGLYAGDDTGKYYDASDWVPDESFVVTDRPWYKNANNNLNPEDFAFTVPYLDAMLNKMCFSLSAKIQGSENNLVIAADVYLDYVNELVNEVATYEKIDGAMFVNYDMDLIIARTGDNQFGKKLTESKDVLSLKIHELLKKGLLGLNEEDLGDDDYFINVRPVVLTNWYLVTYVKKTTLYKELYEGLFKTGIITLICTLLIILITNFHARRMESLRKKTQTDFLTQLYNRDGYESLFNDKYEKLKNNAYMLIIDLDNFKNVNDEHGHQLGDQVLISFAKILTNFFDSNNDIISRLGGDEFIVIKHLNKGEDIEETLEKFISKTCSILDKQYKDIGITPSIGGTFISENLSLETLYNKADTNLYAVKKNGKNGYVVD